MIAYSMLGTNNLPRARAFYDPIVAALGGAVVDAYTSADRVWYGRERTGLLVITKPHDGETAVAANGSMLALSVTSHAKVREVHALALAQGAASEGDPGYRTAPFYGAYFRDLDGHKLCVFSLTEG